jgi:hypothetical protein
MKCAIPRCTRDKLPESRFCGWHFQKRYQKNNLKLAKRLDTTQSLPGKSGSAMIRTGRRKVVMAAFQTRGGVIHNPTLSVSWMLLSALRRPPAAPCTVYDANGMPIATIIADPATGKKIRTPL